MSEARCARCLTRLEAFLDQFTMCFGRRAHRTYANRYCGALGKIANGQVAVSTALLANGLTWITSMELYLPQTWMDDDDRRDRAQIPR